jgi:plastocyanin
MNKYRILLACLLAVSVLGVACGGGGEEAAAPAADVSSPAPPAAAAGSGAITGVINYANGDTDTAISMDADPVCVGLHAEGAETESIVGDEGKLANAFVYIKSGLSGSFPVASEAHVLNQVGCMYTPHVSGVQVGQPLTIKNSDPTLHNVHALPTINAEFNKGQPFQDMEFEHTFDKAEVMVRFKCDVHPWMSSYMGVLDHPFFAVSAVDGSYSIDGVPAGTYTVEVWHETLGTLEMEVTVGEDAAAMASFDYAAAG